MRLRTHRRWSEGQTKTISIVDRGETIPVDARCVWCRQDGLFSHLVGIAFEHVDEHAQQRLGALSQAHDDGQADRRAQP